MWFVIETQCFPFKLSLLNDPICSLGERLSILFEFRNYPLGKLDTFSANARKSTSTNGDLPLNGQHPIFNRQWSLFFQRWALTVHMRVFQTEFKHARIRHRTTPSIAWATFVTLYLLCEGKLKFHLVQNYQQEPVEPIAALPAQPTQARRIPTHETYFDVFFCKTYAAGVRNEGRRFNWVRDVPECKGAFNELPQETQVLYKQIAECSIGAGQELPLPQPIPLQVPQAVEEHIPLHRPQATQLFLPILQAEISPTQVQMLPILDSAYPIPVSVFEERCEEENATVCGSSDQFTASHSTAASHTHGWPVQPWIKLTAHPAQVGSCGLWDDAILQVLVWDISCKELGNKPLDLSKDIE